METKFKTTKMNYIVRRDKDTRYLAQYLHACAFAPVISTFEACFKKGNIISWPGIENINFEKVLINTEATIKGHLDQERKTLQSTKTQVDADDIFLQNQRIEQMKFTTIYTS